jgi:hypothetical protein
MPLPINNHTLPSELQKWLGDSEAGADTALAAVKGMWGSWRESDWIRLEATVGLKQDSTAM